MGGVANRGGALLRDSRNWVLDVFLAAPFPLLSPGLQQSHVQNDCMASLHSWGFREGPHPWLVLRPVGLPQPGEVRTEGGNSRSL